MKAKKLNVLDYGFLIGETREAMMHVASLLPFSPPADAPPDFLRNLMIQMMKQMRAGQLTVRPPWNLKLKYPEFLLHPLQAWIPDEDFELDYHVRHSALPAPGGERELGILISRLHSHPMDFHRPPWEVHFIEGLQGGRFALYCKVHHSLVDGYTGSKLLSNSFSLDPDSRDLPLFFTKSLVRAKLNPTPKTANEANKDGLALESLLNLFKQQWDSTRAASSAIGNVVRAVRTGDKRLVSPLRAPHSPLNRRVSRNRRFATQQFKIDRLRAVAKAANGTMNDVVLALCSGALRQYLVQKNSLPIESLTAMLPVNIRPKDDPGGGNAIAAILANLATDVAEPKARLQAIIDSTKAAKAQLSGMSRAAILQYSALLMSPLVMQQLPGVPGRMRPAFNVVVSNVPGSEQPLYFEGWKLEAAYPVSIPFHGFGLNITVQSYADTLNFGFIGCRDAVPNLQYLAVYSANALRDLEIALGLA